MSASDVAVADLDSNKLCTLDSTLTWYERRENVAETAQVVEKAISNVGVGTERLPAAGAYRSRQRMRRGK